MRFNHWHLGQREGGDVVVLNLPGDAAEVRLLDSDNFQSYQAGQGYRYYGGMVDRSPSEIPIPYSGAWHIAAELPASAGQPHGGIKVVPRAARQPLPRFQQPSLAPIAQAVAEATPAPAPAERNSNGNGIVPDRKRNVFISHFHAADTDAVVRPLAAALQEQGLSVWYDDLVSDNGDSLRGIIDTGLANGRFGIVVLSQHFLARQWPQNELDSMLTLRQTGKQGILPIWHKLTKDEVIAHSPPLAHSISRGTTEATIAEIAAEIAEVIYDQKRHAAAGGRAINDARNE